MRFKTLKEARMYAKIQTIYTKRTHKAVKTQYFSLKDWVYIISYTVILIGGNK